MSSTQSGVIDLAGTWTLSDASGEHRAAITLPGDVVTGLHAAGLIPDPYWGRNEYGVRWIADRDWVLSRSFEADAGSYDLVLSQLDTVAEVRLNGRRVLSAANTFRRWRVPLLKVEQGANTIEITLKSPTKAANARQAAQPFFVPWTKNYPVPNGNMLRKPQCDFGWDWNAALMPSGVYGDIRLEPAAPVRIADVLVHQHLSEGFAEVDVTAIVVSEVEENHRWRFELGGAVASGFEVLRPGETRITARLSIRNPDLWWPAGQGEQPLYELSLQVGDASALRRIGLRSMELISEPDEVGRSFKLRVNGRDVFAKGANWIPADALAGRISRTATRDLLKSAVDANMNMIRIWGGGWYEPDWFYDICDELGLMVWQDAMFACSLYPADEDFLGEVTAEITDVARRLQHRTSLALWCGDNELIGALTWYEESRRDRDRYLVAYDRLNRTIERALKAVDPDANWWPSSPSPGPLSFGDAWHDDSSGDMHFWSVWHEGRDFDHYRDVSPRFCSEFGFQSYPSIDVIRRFAARREMNIASPVMESHQKNAGGNARIAETMFRYFRFPEGFENFVYLSQVQQLLAIKTAVTHWRGLKPHCMGTLYWQLNDTWPVCSWSSLDHGGGWKLLHHGARHFFAPVTVVAVPGDDAVVFRGVNDGAEGVEIALTVNATRPDGEARQLFEGTATLGAEAAEIGRIARDDLGRGEVLTFRWTGSDGSRGEDHLSLVPYKALDLTDTGIRFKVATEGKGWTITLTAQAPAFFTAIEADCPGRFSDNAFLLLPGQPREITFTPQEAGAEPKFTVRDLYSATYA